MTAAVTATRYVTNAVASFRRLSPSRNSAPPRFGKRSRSSHARRRHRIRRRHDRTQHEGRRPRQPTDDPVRHACDCARRDQDQSDRKREDRPDLRPQIAHRRQKGGRLEDGRQDQDEDVIRVEVDRRDAGNEADCEAAKDEQDRIGDADTRATVTIKVVADISNRSASISLIGPGPAATRSSAVYRSPTGARGLPVLPGSASRPCRWGGTMPDDGLAPSNERGEYRGGAWNPALRHGQDG